MVYTLSPQTHTHIRMHTDFHVQWRALCCTAEVGDYNKICLKSFYFIVDSPPQDILLKD